MGLRFRGLLLRTLLSIISASVLVYGKICSNDAVYDPAWEVQEFRGVKRSEMWRSDSCSSADCNEVHLSGVDIGNDQIIDFMNKIRAMGPESVPQLVSLSANSFGEAAETIVIPGGADRPSTGWNERHRAVFHRGHLKLPWHGAS